MSTDLPGMTNNAFLSDVSLTDDQRAAARATLAAHGADDLTPMLGLDA